MDDAGAIPEIAKLRKLEPLAFEGLTPAPVIEGAEPTFEWVDPRDLYVDDAYQRGLSDRSLRLIRKIVEGWDWARFKPPIVAFADGAIQVIDGQHTTLAAVTHGGIARIPVMIVDADSQRDRAASFLGHNRDRQALTPAQLHASGLVAKDPDALAVQRLAAACNVTLLPYKSSAKDFRQRDCMAFRSLYDLLTHKGSTHARRVLSICAAAELAPISAWVIKAVDVLISDDAYRGEVTDADLTRALLALGDGLEKQARLAAAEHGVKIWRGGVTVIFRRASHGKRSRS
jgi:hypothetical protein